MAAPEHARRLVCADGVAIAYRVTPCTDPSASARAIVLLHGLASNLTRWSEFVEHTGLASRWTLVRVDLRGHGESVTRGPIGLERWSNDLAAVLRQEGLSEAVFVGHSLGAQVALHHAAHHPSAGLVLIDPVFRDALHGRWRLLALSGPLLRTAARVVRALNGLGLRRRRLAALDLRALDEQARIALRGSPRDTRDFVRRYSSTRADLRSFRTAHYLQELAEMFRPPPALETLDVPVLLLLSTGGTFADAAATRELAAALPQVRIASIDCQHWPLTEQPNAVRALVEGWCAALEARAAGVQRPA
ncbi:MAG TPA: alpha/beta hydrolase [Burkholderiaceae bacterium]|nr:alpha/beta hydrolase [Burkholderiaceae bacterium]